MENSAFKACHNVGLADMAKKSSHFGLNGDVISVFCTYFYLNFKKPVFIKTCYFTSRDQRASTVAQMLVQHWFHRFGPPSRIHSDQGRNFESMVIQQLCKIYGLKKKNNSLSSLGKWSMSTI